MTSQPSLTPEKTPPKNKKQKKKNTAPNLFKQDIQETEVLFPLDIGYIITAQQSLTLTLV